MHYSFRFYALVLAVAMSVNSCRNFYIDFGDPNSAQYRIDKARAAMDDLDFDAAVSLIEPVIQAMPHDEEVAVLAATAYAGRAGLRSLELFITIGQESGDKGLFQIFAEHFVSATDDDVADIATAVSIVENFQPDAMLRPASVNFLTMFLYYSTIGVLLNQRAYIPDSLDKSPTFTACAVGTFDGLEYTDVDTIMVSVAKIQNLLVAMASSSSLLGDLGSAITVPVALPTDPVPCTAGNTSDVRCLAVRNLVNDASVGMDVAGVCVP